MWGVTDVIFRGNRGEYGLRAGGGARRQHPAGAAGTDCGAAGDRPGLAFTGRYRICVHRVQVSSADRMVAAGAWLVGLRLACVLVN